MTDTLKFKLGLMMTTALVAGASPALAQETETEQPQDEIVVTGRYIPEEKKITSEISAVLNEDTFETTGASDIAGALTRVTGLSLSQGKFVVVRGLNERYSNATLNGSPLPSPEPLRRVAPLDLFPTSFLSDVVVQKTFSPEFSGEFGGGTINMSTRAVPTEPFLELSVSGALNTETSGQEGLTYDGSDSDWTGYDDGLRDLPPVDADGNVTQNFENFSTLIIDQKDEIPGDFGGRVSGGYVWDGGAGPVVGLRATVGYSNDWETRTGADNTATVNGGVLVPQTDLTRSSTENKITLNGLVTLGVEFDGDHSVQFNGLATRQSSAEARTVQGVDKEDRVIRQDFTEWFEREVFMGQLQGEHYFPDLNDLSFNWRGSVAKAGRDAPYERRVNYEDYEDGLGYRFQFNRPGSNNEVNFSELDDDSLDFGGDFVLPVDLSGMFVDLKFGGAYLDKTRESEQASFRYFGTIPSELRESRIDLIFSDPVVDAGILEIRRGGTTGFPDKSEAGLEVIAAYIGADVEVNERVRFAIGGRYEESDQNTAVEQSLVPGSRFDFDPLEADYFLPAATVTLSFENSSQIRLAASKTINRPQFRELTPTIFVNTDTDDRFVGNPFLTNSESINLDARYEMYFDRGEFFTVGVFYKDLTDPIEEFIFNGLGESNATSFLNAPSAELFGVEVEFEKKFRFDDLGRFVPGLENMGDKDLIIRTNYTYADSSVSADGDLPITPPTIDPSQGVSPLILPAAGLYTDGRKLQGQSDHLFNLQVGIEDYEQNWEGTLLFNYTSERIRAVDNVNAGLPAIMEQLPMSLDFVFNYDFELRGGDYTLGLKVQNMLGDDYEATQELGGGEVVLDSYDVGTTFSASLKRRF